VSYEYISNDVNWKPYLDDNDFVKTINKFCK